MDIRITENLKVFRKEHGNTQEDLARHLNISMQAVSKWEQVSIQRRVFHVTLKKAMLIG